MKKTALAKLICFPIMGVLIIALIVGNIIAGINAGSLTGILCPPVVNDEALTATRVAGQTLSEQIVKEGSVLVKNDNALPLDYATQSKVCVFGRTSTDWVIGGSGSGQVVPEDNDATQNIPLLTALENYGVEYYKDLTSMYTRFLSPVGDIGSIGTFYDNFYKLGEPSMSDKNYYSDALLTGAKAYSDVAIVALSRRAGETEDPTRVQYKYNAPIDRTRHYLEISTEEEEMLRYVGENFETVVVLVNSVNVMELGFLETIPGLDACLVVGGTGTRGATGIPYLLYGEDNPSGGFVDTYAYDMSTNINYNFTGFDGIGHYTNGSELYPTNEWSNAGVSTRRAPAYVDYVEGIYVGYKWYETADAENLWDSVDNVHGKGYEGVVQFPFGFGMSYSTFDWDVQSVTPAAGPIDENTTIEITVRVTNNGPYVGKDTVEVYVTPEYHDGGIEKSHVSLVGFAKTGDIEVGKSQAVTISVNAREFASYDCYDKNKNEFAGYEMESGKYVVSLRTDAHTVKTVDFDSGAKGALGEIEYRVAETIKLANDPYTNAEVSNKFTGTDAVDGVSLDGIGDAGGNQNIPFITRASFPTTLAKPADRAMADNVKQKNLFTLADATAWDNADTDAFGNAVDKTPVAAPVQKGLKVYDNGVVTELGLKLGADYNAPEWTDLLNQISISEAMALVSGGSFGNAAIPSVGKPRLSDYDGPSQCRSFNAGTKRGTGGYSMGGCSDGEYIYVALNTGGNVRTIIYKLNPRTYEVIAKSISFETDAPTQNAGDNSQLFVKDGKLYCLIFGGKIKAFDLASFANNSRPEDATMPFDAVEGVIRGAYWSEHTGQYAVITTAKQLFLLDEDGTKLCEPIAVKGYTGMKPISVMGDEKYVYVSYGVNNQKNLPFDIYTWDGVYVGSGAPEGIHLRLEEGETAAQPYNVQGIFFHDGELYSTICTWSGTTGLYLWKVGVDSNVFV